MSPIIVRQNGLADADPNTRNPRGRTGGPSRCLPICLVAVIALASFVTGCTTLGPDYKKPEANDKALSRNSRG